MSLNSNHPKELALHPVECLWVSMLEISERLPKTKGACAAKRAKDHGHRIELSPAAEMVNCCSRQREAPTSAARPIEDDGALAEVRQDVLLDVVVPNRTIGIHKQDVASVNAPPRPNGDVQANGGYQKENKCEHHNDEKHRRERNKNGNVPPLGFWFGLRSAHGVRVGLTA